MSCKSNIAPKTGTNIATEILSIGVGVSDERQTLTVHQKLLQKVTKHFDKNLATETGQRGLIFLNDEDPVVFKILVDYLYTGVVLMPPVNFRCKTPPNPGKAQELEADLRMRFDAHQQLLARVYSLAERYNMDNLMNTTIDSIQNGFLEYGTVFGPRLLVDIFQKTKPGSKLRELCVATNVIHMDRGCSKLRDELAYATVIVPEFLPAMLTWISRNFGMFSRRYEEG